VPLQLLEEEAFVGGMLVHDEQAVPLLDEQEEAEKLPAVCHAALRAGFQADIPVGV
jgi:hypothetical protein